jgi:hypothetical protein
MSCVNETNLLNATLRGEFTRYYYLNELGLLKAREDATVCLSKEK